ncbi:amidohydrolase family protein [Micromonospora sp. B11E3]|uniref:amidohydrolase family protein n=1 Tax=Micromonospora sp. B11E3 TaxID=3153562 RepID=UPI00325EE9D4
MSTELAERLDAIQLIDHHVHSVLATSPDRADFEQLITESDRPAPAGTTQFDSQVGFAIRRHCGARLGLDPDATADEYWTRRTSFPEAELVRRFLGGAGVDHWLVDSGWDGGRLLPLDQLRNQVTGRVGEILRLETLLETVAAGATASTLHRDFVTALTEAQPGVVGLKSIVAYRYGFDFEPDCPSESEIRQAAGRWLATAAASGPFRVDDPVLLRMLLWEGVRTGLPLQLHAGYGDPDLELHRCDPLLLTRWIKAVEPTGTKLMLLHCYPFHRNAGFLAHAFPHVYLDVGLTVNYTGAASAAVIRESLELAPFAKILYSSDAWGPPELHFLGARLWRRGITAVLAEWVAAGEWSTTDAIRVATMIGRSNAERVYGLADDE